MGVRQMNRLDKEGFIGKKTIASSRKQIRGSVIPHFHDFYEIEYVIAGSGTCTVNGRQIPCADGTLVFLTPVDYHSVQTDGAEVFNVMFSEQLVDLQRLEPFLRASASKVIVIEPQQRPFFEMIFGEIVKSEENAAYVSALMDCLLLKLAQLYPKDDGGSADDAVSRIHLYIIHHYRERITLERVAAHVGLTPSYVSALFKNEMKIGFKSYLNSLRLEYAGKLLQYTERSVKQICAESGFEDVPNFIKRFKAYYGVTPTAMRRGEKKTHAAE